MTILSGILEEGLIYAIMALGVYITYKILDFPDLSVDGTFPLGAALTAAMLVNGTAPFLALPASFLAGALAGCITGLIHVRCRVRDLFSGIIVMTSLYSVNLRIAGMKANLPFLSKDTIFDNPWIRTCLPAPLRPYAVVLILAVITLLCKFLLDWYLGTRSGYLLRAAGDNDTLVISLAVDKGRVKIIGLSIANGFAALAGGIFAQKQAYFDVSVGTGTMVFGLASVILGTQLFKRFHRLRPTTAVIVGSILYKACVALVISVRLIKATDLKLVTAVILLFILFVSDSVKRRGKRHA
ncbi:MAG: ABC transporter permease [Lachnospiraceae bacterium]|jgi:putative ABC transport system permease protein|nr:ABC transporter permease [Lachnospiraceae bacterium]